MKNLFLTSYFAETAEIFAKNFGELQGKKVLFVATASKSEEINFYVEEAKNVFEKMKMIVNNFDISDKTPAEIEEKIHQNDCIYFSGGNTFFLLQEMQQTWSLEIFKTAIESGKLYIGESAGSIIVAKNIDYIEQMDNKNKAQNLKNTDGLGLIDFAILPHFWNFPFAEIAEKILQQYEKILDLKTLSNNEAMIVRWKNFQKFAV